MKYLIVISLFLLGCINIFSETLATEQANVKIIVSSPPLKYGDTVDMGTFEVGDKWHAGCLIENVSKKDLILDRTTSSDPRLKCKVWLDTIPPGASGSVWGMVKCDKPSSNFKIKTEIYWKNIKKPTVVYFTGKCVNRSSK